MSPSLFIHSVTRFSSTVSNFSSTVSPSLLDHVYCKLRNAAQIAGIAIFDVSDHLPIFLLLSTSINRKAEKQIIRCMKNFNLENFLIDLEEALSPWNFNTGSTVHNDFDEFIHIFQTIINKHAPFRKSSRREKQLQAKPWKTRGLLTSIKNKNRMFRKCHKCKDAKLIVQYKKYTNKLRRLRKIAKQQHYFKLFQKYRSNSKKTWKTINESYSTHQKQSSDINSLKLNDGTRTSCPITISNTLNEYFSSTGVSMGNGIRPTNTSFTTFMKSISKSFVLDGTCAEEVIACINNLRNTSSSGIDGISTKFLKLAKSTIAPILAKLFNKSMECREYPDCLKISQIVPIPKCSSPSIPSHYRPISICQQYQKYLKKLFMQEYTIFLIKINFLQTFNTGLEIMHQLNWLYLPFMKVFWKTWIMVKAHVLFFSI